MGCLVLLTLLWRRLTYIVRISKVGFGASTDMYIVVLCTQTDFHCPCRGLARLMGHLLVSLERSRELEFRDLGDQVGLRSTS
jgi:hypothetical protein